jgi:PAS domain S-box-containing protein
LLAAATALARARRSRTEAEHILVATHDRASTLSTMLPVGVFHTDPDGRCVFVNERACEITGLERDRLLGTGWRDAVHPDDRDRLLAAWRDATRNQRDFRSEFRVLGTTGEVWVLGQAKPQTDGEGRTLVYIGAITDITDRKRFEEQLHEAQQHLERRVAARTSHLISANRELEREVGERQEAEAALIASERRLRDVLDNTTAVIYVKDLDSRYILINRQFANLFHTTREEAEGKTDFDIFPKDVATAFRRNDQKVIEAEAPMEFDESAPHDDGPHRYLSLKFPLYDAHRRFYAVCGISTDVTERERAQAERSRIFNLSPDLMAITSFDGYFKIVNPQFEKVLGYSEEELLTMPIMDLVHAEDREAAIEEFDTVKAGNPTLHFENRARCKDGTYKWFAWRATPVPEERCIYTVGHDITREKRLEEEIRRRRAEMARNLRTQTMGEMAFGIAHELNQPLGAVVNFASGCIRRLESGEYRPDDLRRALDQIASQGLRAGDLIRRIRDFVMDDELDLERVDVNAVVRSSVRLLETASARSGLVRLDLADDLPAIEADSVQLEQVLLNLLRNGLEAMDGMADAELVVTSAKADADAVEITVTDRGGGLGEDVASHIFEPFFTTEAGGLGIGLAISRTIIEAHGGRLSAEPAASGGTTFRVRIPVSTAGADALVEGHSEPPDVVASPRKGEPRPEPLGRRHGAIGRRHGSAIGRRHGPPDEDDEGPGGGPQAGT